jgi:hypothetical protein
MDDFKLIAKSEEQLRKQIQRVKTFSDDIHMDFGLEKCAKITFKKGTLTHSQNLVIDINREIQELEQGKTYKYLGIEESEAIKHQQMKERLKQEDRRRLRMILKSELNSTNTITAIGALAVPVLRYSFGIINWRIEETKQIDRKTRKMLTMYKIYHPKADIDRLFVKRKEGGGGLVQDEATYKAEIVNIAEYLNTEYKEDQFVNIVKVHESTQPNTNSILMSAAKIIEELNELNGMNDSKQDEMQHRKGRLGEVLKKKWKNKVMQGQYIRNMDRQLISEKDTFLWLSKGDLKAETEGEIVAAQDQALNRKYYGIKILHTETDSKCRLCQQLGETIDHIISACSVLAKEQYGKRHDKVSAQIHFNICKEIGVQLDKKHWYEHVPKSVVTNKGGKVTILWNQQMQTDRTIPNNKPDIIIRDNGKGTCILIDVAIPVDRNVIKKEAEKILKYKDLTTEIQCMWNVKARVIAVIIGATGTVSKSFRKYVSDIPGNQGVKEIQNSHIGHCMHTSGSANVKEQKNQRRN